MQRARVAFLWKIPEPQKILVLGEGPGSFLVMARQVFPNAEITCLDASSAMLEKTKQRLQRHNISLDSVTFLHQDLFSWQPLMQTYDLIVTNFFLDCFTAKELEHLVPILSRAATSNALWLIADFQISRARIMEKISQLLVKTLYLFFRRVAAISATELASPHYLLEKNGFQLQEYKELCGGLLRSESWKAA